MTLFRRVALAALIALAPLSLVLTPVVEAAVVYSAATKTARMTAVRDLLNGGKLELLHSDGSTVLATVTLNATSGSVTGSVLTFSFVATTVTASATGTCTTARFRTAANADVITGLTCGTSGTDVVVSTTAVTSGVNVIVNSYTLTHA